MTLNMGWLFQKLLTYHVLGLQRMAGKKERKYPAVDTKGQRKMDKLAPDDKKATLVMTKLYRILSKSKKCQTFKHMGGSSRRAHLLLLLSATQLN